MHLHDDAQRVVLRDLLNGKNGHCWINVPAQAYAVDGGWPVGLVERAFSHTGSVRLYNLSAAARRLTIAVLDVSEDPFIEGLVGAMTGPQVGTDPESTQRLALDYRKPINHPADLRNTLLYMDPILGGGGHGGMEAVRALSEGLGIDLPMGREIDVLEQYIGGSTAKRMALHDEDAGHWSLQVFMVG